MDEGSGSSVLFANCFEMIDLPNNQIYEDTGNAYGFDEHKSNPIGRVSFDVMLMEKVLTIDFFPMGCKSPYNTILGRDWNIPMEVIASIRFQCIKFPHNEKIAKVHNN